ncbi:MAG TPA: tetratricopeptide repeat protein [Kofleriaceae bacterium]|nr:tetratricopeptide repeat protein [Kofleriaceae bacterium]
MNKLAIFAAILFASSIAAADDIGRKLARYEQEAQQLGSQLPQPNQPYGPSAARLVDAEVEYSLGDYDTAALHLFDLAKPTSGSVGADNEAAVYYLAQSLLQKGDRGAARTYFQQIVKANTPGSKYYEPALERLVEIAIASSEPLDSPDTQQVVGALNSAQRAPSVPYVLGKLAFAKGDFDGAQQQFDQVPKGSDYELQAEYYTGTVAVAKKDLARATEIFTDLANRKPRTPNDRRMKELAQLALGRVYYEREEPGKSIDSYVTIDRHSDLFPDALYEVAWVYVKSKQFDKALRALELLEQSDPNTTKSPTTRILEGNLRIRKAQMIRTAQIEGTFNPNEHGDPGTEYDKANKLFTETHDQYMPGYLALTQMVQGSIDPGTFVDQIAGHNTHVFQLAAPIPDAAAQWLRDEPGVQRFVSVEDDIAGMREMIAAAKRDIARIEGAIAAKDHAGLYPELAQRRSRIAAIEDDLVHLRDQLADSQLRLVDGSADLAQLTATRKQLSQQYAGLGNPEQAFAQRVAAAQQGFDKLDDVANDVENTIGSAQAMAVALRKYSNDVQPAMAADQKAQLTQQLDDAAREAQAIEDEIAQVHDEVVLGKDLAAVGDDMHAQAREARRHVREAQDAEQHVLDGFASASHDRGQSQQLVALADRAWRLADDLDKTDATIAASVEQGIAQAQTTIAQEKANVVDYEKQLADYEKEAREIGSTQLGASFKDVQAKFYDIIARTDVGVVDVAWSQKEDSDDDLKRLNLSRARELKQLKDEFHDVLDANVPKPSEKKATTEPEMPKPTDADKAKPEDRIKPGGDDKAGNAQPTVKPDEQKKKGGGR